MKEKIEIQKNNYEWLLNSINNADAKAGFLITVNLALIGFSITQLNSILDSTNTLCYFSTWIFSILFGLMIFTLLSLAFAIAALWPRFTKDSNSLFYYNSIRNLTKDEYGKRMISSDDMAILNDITGQVWYLSKIIRNKYKNIRIGIMLFSLSLLLLILTYLMGA